MKKRSKLKTFEEIWEKKVSEYDLTFTTNHEGKILLLLPYYGEDRGWADHRDYLESRVKSCGRMTRLLTPKLTESGMELEDLLYPGDYSPDQFGVFFVAVKIENEADEMLMRLNIKEYKAKCAPLSQ
ncbi:hypothetical protein RMR21_009510 [Agrobacterium sp. rho-8.1]|nr:hypothetical protein [Agrobacterium sp. rho-8.1]